MHNTIALPTPVQITIPSQHPNGEPRDVTLKTLRVHFVVDSARQMVVAFVPELRRPFSLYSSYAFANHAAYAQEQHLARFTQLMGEDTRAFLQSIADQTGEIQPAPVSSEIQNAMNAAAASFETLSLGKQALWQPVRQAVANAILAGDMATAAGIMTTVPALYEGAEEDRQIFMALFAPPVP